MGFEDLVAAAEMRDVIEQIATGVVNKMRPDVIVGKVFSVDRAGQKAGILLPGETVDNLLIARFALDKIPTKYMASSYSTLGLNAPGDIVRLWGKPGSYFILDYVSGAPEGGSQSSGGTGKAGQTFYFTTASLTWICSHTFNTTSVDVTTYTSAGVEIQGDVTILDTNRVQIEWGAALAGYALIQE